MNAQVSSPNHSSGEPTLERKKERICWPCILAAIPPLLITLVVGWFVVSALEQGRKVQNANLSIPVDERIAGGSEGEADAAFEILRLQEDLDAANKALADAQARLSSESGAADNADLAKLQADLKKAEAAAAAGEKERASLSEERASLGEELAKLREELKLRDQGLAQAAGDLAEAESQVADLQKRYADESERRSEAQTTLAVLRKDAEKQASDAEARIASLTQERDEALAKQQDAVENAVKASTALKQEKDRSARLQASLELARAGLARTTARDRGDGKEDEKSAGGPASFLAWFEQASAKEREEAYAEIGSLWFSDPEFGSWIASDAAREDRATLATLIAPQSVEAGSDTAAAAETRAKLEAAQTALSEAEAALAQAQKVGAEAEKEATRLSARLASREAQIARLEASAQQAEDDAKATAKAHRDELERLSVELDAAEKAAASASAPDPKNAADSAEKATRILELEKALSDARSAAPSVEALEELKKRVATLEAEAEDAALALREEAAARTGAQAALARLSAEGGAKAGREATQSGPRATLTLPEIGEVSADKAPEAVSRLIAEHKAALRKLAAALTAAQAKRVGDGAAPAHGDGGAGSQRLTLPEIGEIEIGAAPKAVADLLARKDDEARGLRAANAGLLARLSAAPTTAAGRIDLPEIGPIEPEKAPDAVVRLLAVRDRSLKAALTENVALKAKLASVEGSAVEAAPTGRPGASSKPASDGAAAAAVYPKWREAPLQTVGGVDLNVLSEPIAFDSASAELTKSGRNAVRKLARQLLKSLKKAPKQQWRLVIEGHTDQRPIRTKEFGSNWDLSSARAAAVAWELQKQGVPSSRLLAVGRASADPVDARWTRSAFAMNRRIELSLIRRGGPLSRAEEK